MLLHQNFHTIATQYVSQVKLSQGQMLRLGQGLGTLQIFHPTTTANAAALAP
jgi:hypothetical protein